MSMTEIALEDVTKLEPGQIMADSIRQWRSDCQAGQFKVGQNSMRGPRIDMELISAQLSEESSYFGYPPMRRLALLFVDIEGVVSTILFKTESLDNFAELSRSYRLKGESLLGKVVRATMSKRSSRASGNGYFAVEFEVIAKKGKFFSGIQDFRQNCYRPGMIRLLESKPANQPALENK